MNGCKVGDFCHRLVQRTLACLLLATLFLTPVLASSRAATGATPSLPPALACGGHAECLAAHGPVVKNFGWGFGIPGAIASDGTHVWVTGPVGETVTELDASTGALVRVIGGPSTASTTPTPSLRTVPTSGWPTTATTTATASPSWMLRPERWSRCSQAPSTASTSPTPCPRTAPTSGSPTPAVTP